MVVDLELLVSAHVLSLVLYLFDEIGVDHILDLEVLQVLDDVSDLLLDVEGE